MVAGSARDTLDFVDIGVEAAVGRTSQDSRVEVLGVMAFGSVARSDRKRR